MGIVIAILLFSGIVIFHELGHFLLAKANKIHVDEFSLGLGPTLFGKVIGGTKFSLKLLPFGGACMMGEDEAEETPAPLPMESHRHPILAGKRSPEHLRTVRQRNRMKAALTASRSGQESP